MQSRTAGEDQLFFVDILVDGEFAVPDAGSIKLTLRDNPGSIFTGFNAVAQVDTNLSTVLVTVPSAQNSIGSALFETRYVKLDYKVGGRPFSESFMYRLTPFLPIQSTERDVRGLVGADEKELPDEDIDLVKSYFILLDEYGAAFGTALTDSTVGGLYANQAIAIHAALEVLPSLQLKIRQVEKFNNAESQRGKIDFEQLKEDLQELLTRNLEQVFSANVTSQVVLMVSSPTDVITG